MNTTTAAAAADAEVGTSSPLHPKSEPVETEGKHEHVSDTTTPQVYIRRAEQYTPPPETQPAEAAEAEAEASAAAEETAAAAAEVDDNNARRLSGQTASSRMLDVSGSDELSSDRDSEDVKKAPAHASGSSPGSAQAHSHQRLSKSSARTSSARALSRAHPAFGRKSKNALTAIAGGTDVARQSSFQLPPKPGTRSRTASSDNGSDQRTNFDEHGRARARDSRLSMASSSSRDYSSRDHSGTDPTYPHTASGASGHNVAAAAPTQRAGEWLRLRPRAQRQTIVSDAYVQHSEAYHDHAQRGGQSADGGHTHGLGTAFGRGGHPPRHQYGDAHHQYDGHQPPAVNSSAYLAHGGRAFNPRQIFFPANTIPEPLAHAAHLRLEDSQHETVERPVWRSVGPEVQQQYAMHGEDLIGKHDDDDEDDDRSQSSDDSSSIDEERPRPRSGGGNKNRKKAKTDASVLAKEAEEDEAARALEAAVLEGRKKAETATDDEKAPTPEIIPVATDGDGAIVAGAMDPRQITPLASISPYASDSVSAITDNLSALTAQLDTDTENELSEVGAHMTPAERQQYRAMLYAQHYAALAAQAQAQALAQAQVQAQAQAQAQAQGGDPQGFQQSTAAGGYAIHPYAQALGISAATAQLQQQQLYALENPDVNQMMAYQQAQATYLAQQAQYAEWIAQQQQLMMQQQQQQQQREQAADLQQEPHQQAPNAAAKEQAVHEGAVDAVPTPPPEGLGRKVSGGKQSVVSSAAFSAQPTVQARGGGFNANGDGIEEESESSSYEDEPEAFLPNDEEIQEDGIAYRQRKSGDNGGGGEETHPSDVAEMCEMQSAVAYHLASPDSKYEKYACRVDVAQGDRSTEISLFSAARPHMRGFHFSWLGFFFAFLAWFAIAPLLPEIQRSLHLSRDQIWNSSICSVAAGVVFRVLGGPLSDKYGARWIMSIFLVCAGIPCMCTGFVNSGPGLSVLRTVIGIGGATFVPMQYWTSSMFTREVAGTANSLAAGWGNLGGGVTQILIGSILLPLFKVIYGETDPSQPANKSWRTVCVFPGLMCCALAVCTIRYSDDCPKGNYRKRERLGLMPSVSAGKSLRSASSDRNTWLLIIQYACCFGVELTMSNAAVLYFTEAFGLSIERASAIASIFGWMNLFARGLGGFTSDMMNASKGMRGRLIFQSICLACQGGFVVIFGYTKSLGGAVVVMIIFSLFVQASEGAIYAVIPYVRPPVTGSVAGCVGAGGNLGGVVFSIIFRYWDYRPAFIIMGVVAAGSALLSPLIVIQGQSAIFCNCADRARMGLEKVQDSMVIRVDPFPNSEKGEVDDENEQENSLSTRQSTKKTADGIAVDDSDLLNAENAIDMEQKE